MNDNNKKTTTPPPVEKHYERRLIDAKGEVIKDLGPVVDFLINMHAQAAAIAEKHRIDADVFTDWVLAQLPITRITTGIVDDEEDEEYEEEE